MADEQVEDMSRLEPTVFLLCDYAEMINGKLYAHAPGPRGTSRATSSWPRWR